MKIKCPRCGQDTVFNSENPYRPFCSERCQLIDLGAWADESYRMPLQEEEKHSVNENPEEDGSAE